MTATADGLCLDPASTAFLVVDMQNDFLDPEGYFARRGLPVRRLRRAIAPIHRLRRSLPPGVKVMLTAQRYEPDGSDDLARVHVLKPAGLMRSGNDLPVQGDGWGSAFVPGLEPGADGRVVFKRRFDAFHQTDLELLLRCWGVKTLIIGGVVVDVCVESTLRAAYVRDFDVILATDCVAGWQAADVRRTAEVVRRHFGLCLSNAEIEAALRRRSGG